MHYLVELAYKTINKYVTEGLTINPDAVPDEALSTRAGVFVSIKKHGALRGCIGTFQPVRDNVAQEVIYNAISASTQDPRFPPVQSDEMADLDISVDVLSPPEHVDDTAVLDHNKYGVIVSHEGRRGLLLPDLEGVDSVEQQLNIAMMKAGIDPATKDIKIQRFEVTRYR